MSTKGLTPPVATGLVVGGLLILTFAFLAEKGDKGAKDDFDAKFARHIGTMILSVDMRSIGNNNSTSIGPSEQFNQILNILTKCEHSQAKLYYALGSMEVALDGADDSGICPMAIDIQNYNDIQPDREMLDCSVLLGALANWMTWTNRVSPSAAEISDFSTKVGN